MNYIVPRRKRNKWIEIVNTLAQKRNRHKLWKTINCLAGKSADKTQIQLINFNHQPADDSKKGTKMSNQQHKVQPPIHAK